MQAKNLIAALIVSLTAGAAFAADTTGNFFDFTAADTGVSSKTRADVQAEAVQAAKTALPLRERYSFPLTGKEFFPALTRAEVKSQLNDAEGFSSVANNEVFDTAAYAKAAPARVDAIKAAQK